MTPFLRRIFCVLVCASICISVRAESLTIGFHAHKSSNVPSGAELGYSAIRLWDSDTAWSSIAPREGMRDYARLAQYLEAAKAAKLSVILVLGNTPKWASSRPDEPCAYGTGCAAPPRDMDDWRRYVRQLVLTFKGQIECYEPWNEVSFPDDPLFPGPGTGGDPGQFFSGRVSQLVEISRIVWEEVKQHDPTACVLSPSFHSSGNWADKFDAFLAAGGKQYFDVVSQHFYFAQQPEQVIPVIASMRRVMQKNGVTERRMWNTEVGTDFRVNRLVTQGYGLATQAYSVLLRSYVLNLGMGVSRIYWYALDNGYMGFTPQGWQGEDLGAAAKAANAVMREVTAASCAENNGVWICRLSVGDKTRVVLWKPTSIPQARWLTLTQAAYKWRGESVALPIGTPVALDEIPVVLEQGAKSGDSYVVH